MDLLEILLQLADEGHNMIVAEQFKYPIQHCPDLLLLGLLQSVS